MRFASAPTYFLGVSLQAVRTAVFLAAEVAYLGLHVRPLLPLLPTLWHERGSDGSHPPAAVDSRWMQCFTASHFFASECALLSLVALASPISGELPAAVAGTHLAFHVLYLTITLAAPQWAVAQNTQVSPSRSWSSRGAYLARDVATRTSHYQC